MSPSLAPVAAVQDTPRGLLEAPCWAGGVLAFSDVLLGGVWELDGDGTVRCVLERRRGIGGIAGLHGGGLVVSGRDISVLRDGELRTIHADGEAKGFNDIVAMRDGGLVVGVLRFAPLAGEPPSPGKVVRLTPDGGARTLTEELLWPNGIVECADGALLVSDYARGHVVRIDPDSGAGEVFFALDAGEPDGLALDAEGGLWIAGGSSARLLHVGPDATLRASVDVAADFVSSLCFAGPQLDRLYVTTAGSLLAGHAPVPGAPVGLARL